MTKLLVLRRSLLALAVLAVTGCSTLVSAPSEPAVTVPPTTIPTPLPDLVPPPPPELPPDPVPRAEPRSRYGNPASYEVFGRRYFVLAESRGFRERGTASWYGPGFHGERTSSGEPYDMYAMTAAHKTLPLPAYVRVHNLTNGRSVVVRVNDRGPFVGERIIDLSYAAAAKLDMLRHGTASVEISVLEPPGDAPDLPAPPQPVLVASPAPAPTATPVSTPAATPSAAAEAAVGRFVQAGAFAARENADRLVASLRRAGFADIAVQPGQASSGQPVYRVQIGPVDGAAQADDVIERLALAGVPDARLAHPSVTQ